MAAASRKPTRNTKSNHVYAELICMDKPAVLYVTLFQLLQQISEAILQCFILMTSTVKPHL